MSNEKVKEYDKSYHPPETIRISYCAAVLAVVMEHHHQAKELFEDIKDCVLLAGVQESFSILEHEVPEGKEILEGIAIGAGYNENSKVESNSAKVSRRLLSGGKDYIACLTDKLILPVMDSERCRSDLEVLTESMDQFIRVCFNSESARSKGIYRVTGDSSTELLNLLYIKALFSTDNKKYRKYYRIFKRMGDIPMFKHGKKFHSVDTVLDGEMPTRAQRELISQYMEAGFKLKHGKVIETTAWRWYQCRVVYSSVEKFCDSYAAEQKVLDPKNVTREIRPCDDAVGYQRRIKHK